MIFTRTSLALLSVASLSAAHSQQALHAAQDPSPSYSYDGGLFSPVGTLSALATSEYTVLSHPFFPRHSTRIKKTYFCDPTVASYTGYIDVGAKHLFFYFFESRDNPARDDIIFWTNGGPGCSSSMGLFMEIGPCRVVNATTTAFHPESWNTNANIMFVDQPVGTGFSYADYAEFVDTTEDAAQDIIAFMVLFFENFPSFKNRALHMAGESYGGRYIPLFSAAIWDQNAELVARDLTPINLTSAMISNGLTDPYTMTPSYYDMTCTSASVPPVFDISTCIRMKQALPRCEKWLKESCLDHLDHMDCAAAEQFCETELMAPIESIDINPHDISKPCGSKELICYPIVQEITKYLDNPDTRSMLGVDPPASQNFQDCDLDVMFTFLRNGDRQRPSHEYVAALLERGVRVLVYVGDFDWVCNWIGNERWTLALEWSGHGEFRAEKLRDWEVDGEIAGKTRSAKGFTFATIAGAGHMAPYDKPKQSLALLQRWMAGAAL